MSTNQVTAPQPQPRTSKSSNLKDKQIKSKGSSGCTSPTKSEEKRLPPIKAPVGLAKGPDLKNVKSKVGSFQNLKHKPAAGEKKQITQKLEWKAASKVGSLDYAHHKPGGGAKKILEQKLEWKASSRIASLENIKHRPGGGTVRIFNERYSGRSMSEVRKPASSQPRQPSQLRCTSPTSANKPNGQANPPANPKPQTAKPDLNSAARSAAAAAPATNQCPTSNSTSGHSSRVSSGGQTNGGIQQKQPNNSRLINDLENLSINKPAQVNNTQKIDLLS